ncbi:MAG: glycogen-binding domain-containing protein [Planctomycetes bacterium]|nr:glycogen-binding domain-containing protein [Planctomycetota bacterium]
MHEVPKSLICVCLLGALAGAPAMAAGPDAVNGAVEKAKNNLLSRQDPKEGAFRDHWAGEGYRSGETALALLALLKAGVPAKDRRISAGFNWYLSQPLERIYDVSVGVLALEARYMPESKASIQDPKPLSTQVRKRFKKKASPRDRRWLQQAVAYLQKHQDKGGLWRYPNYGDADVSNAQFAILALKSAHRLGVKVDPQVFWRAAVGLVEAQQKTGPKVASFPVPAAERAIAGLEDRRAKAKKKKRAKRKHGTQEREAPVREGGTLQRQRARGWGYRPGDAPRGSMTAAGVAILVVCKSELEGYRRYEERLGGKVDQSLRDGAAWLAHHFAVDKNPGAEPDWLFYYLYTLERAGTLLALERFGGRAWYEEGTEVILSKQQGDGSFDAQTSGSSDGGLAGTCLALLFLKRSTIPVMKRVVTGHTATPAASAAGPEVKALTDGRQEVTFRYRTTPGRRVHVAGSFNSWSKGTDALRERQPGVYVLTITIPKGPHQYKFVVDGSTWTADPANQRRVPDGHGGHNSLLGS